MKNIFLSWLLVMAITFPASTCFAGWMEDVKLAFKNKNNEKAFQLVEAEAEKGNSEAQIFLATMFINGVSVAPDEIQGLALMMVAAGNGSTTASNNVEFIKKRIEKEKIDKAHEIARNHRWKRSR